MIKNENEVTHRIVRGVNVKVVNGKRGALAFVILSKNRQEELNALKTSPFYQTLTLIDGRDDKIVFRTNISSFDEAESFVDSAVTAASEVGVGNVTEPAEMLVNTKKNTKSATA